MKVIDRSLRDLLNEVNNMETIFIEHSYGWITKLNYRKSCNDFMLLQFKKGKERLSERVISFDMTDALKLKKFIEDMDKKYDVLNEIFTK